MTNEAKGIMMHNPVVSPATGNDKVDKRYCQNCRHQENNPSRCHLRQYHVARKDTCDNFGIKR